MNVFLTGATGFIGRHVTELLAREGHSVRCLVRDPSRAEWMRTLPGLQIVAGDLFSQDVVERCIAGSDAVLHLAGLTRSLKKKELFEINGTATGRLAGMVRRAGPPGCRLVYLSSLAAAGPGTSARIVREECTPSPVSAYGESKLRGERLLREEMDGGEWTIVRAPAVYGPWDRDVLFLFRLARRGIILQVRNAAREVSIIHAADLARALHLASTHRAASGRIYHLSDGRRHGLADIAAALRAAAGRGVNVTVPAFVLRAAGIAGDVCGLFRGRPALLNSDKVKESLQCGWVCDDARIREELGFKANIPLAEGFRETWAWYRRHNWL